MIKVLEKNIADKIAAGEVVERPLSIVKELVENSIDAGASKIVVEIKDGGKTYIRVSDDGFGINPDECETAFMRHATSKIEKAEDLDAIGTLGFRGEALASIAAVSRTELLTKVKENQSGRKVVIEGGEVVENTMIGCPDGTTMIVRDLFYNTPARLKFLKSSNAESSAVIEFVTHIALAYPDIKVRMISNEKILFSTNGKGNRLNTIGTLTSKIHTSNLIPFNFEENNIKLEGYVSGPGESKNSRKNQVFFVNGRVINSKVIDKGINQAYSDRLFEGRFPICYLFLTILPETMDVNIHPNKREVRFYDEGKVTDVVRNGIISALNSVKAVPEIKEKEEKKLFTFKDYTLELPKEEKQETIVKEAVDIKNILSNYEDSIKKTVINIAESVKHQVVDNVTAKEEKTVTEEPITRFDFTKLNIVGQFFNTYIQLTDDDAIYFIDQHAAHERVFFEKILNQYISAEKLKQQILLPITINVSHSDKERENEWIEPLLKMGFTIDEFGPQTYRITEIPMFLDMGEAENFLNDYIDNIGSVNDFKDKKTIDKIATRACKAAVKANDKLSDEEIKQLLKDMSNCENPFSCPHGRPVFIKITKSDMEKRFKRK